MMLAQAKFMGYTFIMYRYSDKKNRQENKRFHQKQLKLNQKSSSAPVVKGGKKKSGVRSRRSSKTKNTSSKTTLKAKKTLLLSRRLPWLPGLIKVLGYLLVSVILVAATIFLCLNSFLPLIYTLENEQTLLLIDNEVQSGASKLYLVRVLPEAKTISVLALPPSMLVPVAGQHGTYPLGQVAPFLTAEGQSVVEIRKSHNLAFGLTLDELYFVLGLSDLENLADVKRNFNLLLWQTFEHHLALPQELLDLYFTVRSSSQLKITTAETLDQVLAWGKSGGIKAPVTACPLVIVNAAGADGLAGRVSQILEQNGLEVRHMTTATQVTGSSKIYYDETVADCQEVVRQVQETLPQQVEVIADQGEQARKDRGLAVVYLGEEISN
jgi:hypothetical protein